MNSDEKEVEIHEKAKAYYEENKTLVGAPHGTSKEHFEKYRDMNDVSGLAITDLLHFSVRDIDDLTQRYLKNKALNNIPLKIFDSFYAGYRIYQARPPANAARTASEYTCCMKWLLIYECLKMVPEFTNRETNNE